MVRSRQVQRVDIKVVMPTRGGLQSLKYFRGIHAVVQRWSVRGGVEEFFRTVRDPANLAW